MPELKYQNPASTDAVLDTRVSSFDSTAALETRREVVEAKDEAAWLQTISIQLADITRCLLKLVGPDVEIQQDL